MPSTDPLGESSTENIHGVPWLERKIKELLRAEVLARTSIWSTAIEKLGGSTSSFVEAFMEGSKKHKIFMAKEMYAMARKKTKKVDLRSIVPSPNAEIGDPCNMSGGALIERAPKVFLGEPEGDVSKIVMGEKAHLYLGTSAFNGNTGSLSLDDEVCQMGWSEASTYAFSHLIKATEAVVLLSQNIVTSEERKALQSARDAALKEKEKLELPLRKEKKRSSESEQQLKARVAHIEARLEQQTTQVKAERVMSKKIQIRAIAQTRRDLMMEFMNGEHVNWAALKEVQMCEDILNVADGDEDAEEVEGYQDRVEQENESSCS
ncbi:hypothetical protein OROMI_021334 [Orobanche minor]